MKKVLCLIIVLTLVMSSSLAFASNGKGNNGKGNYKHDLKFDYEKEMKKLKDQLKKYFKDEDMREDIIDEILDLKDEYDDETTSIFINGVEYSVNEAPVIKYGNIQLPTKPITNGMGANLNWNANTKTITITKGNITLVMRLDKKTITINGAEVKNSVLTSTKKNKTILLIKFIAQVLGHKAETDDSSNSVVVDNDGSISVNDSIAGKENNQFEFKGKWSYGSQAGAFLEDNHWSSSKNSYYKVDFTGTQIKLYGAVSPYQGIAAVSIDGGREVKVDFYAKKRADNVLVYTSPVLSPGQHTLKVRVTGTKNRYSKGTTITADRVSIIGNATTPSLTNLALNKNSFSDSVQPENVASKGNDGNTSTRWCAADGAFNHWWTVDLGNYYNISGSEVMWEKNNNVYRYKVEVSADNSNWTLKVDKTNNTSTQQTQTDSFSANGVRFVRLTVTDMSPGSWASFYEFKVFGDNTVADTQAPTAPSNLVVAVPLTSEAVLNWSASTDNVSVVGYKIFRNGTQIGTVTNSTSFRDKNLCAATSYVYTVSAYDAAGNISNQCTPAAVVTPAANSNGTGLKGEYFNNVDFTDLKLTRVDGTVNFNWNYNRPNSSTDYDTFSVRWTGQVQPLYSENYTFYTTSDDGVRLWVNGQKLIDNWTEHGATQNSGTITLTSGQKYDIRLEYFDKTGEAEIKLYWSSSNQSKQIIPQSQLFPGAIDDQAPTVPSGLTASAASTSQVVLNWTASTDNAGIAGYKVFRNGNQITTVTNGVTYVDSGLKSGTTYVYAVLAYDVTGNQSSQSTPVVVITPLVNGSGSGIKGEYFNNMDLTSLKTARVDDNINFNWNTSAPVSSMGADRFSVRWTGQIQPLYSETYTFYTVSDDGVRLWVNGQKVIDNWVDHSSTENSGTISLSAGQKYDIKLEYYDNSGDAVAKLLWSSASQSKQIVPKSQLYPAQIDTQVPTVPTGLTAAAVSSNQINLSWTASTDNAGVVGYKVYRNGSQIGIVTSGTAYTDSGLTANTPYIYAVLAFDASGNSSAQCLPIVATTTQQSNTNVALNKTASADSQDAANPASKGNDGNTATRWCAADGSFNHWWKVDLGGLYNLTGSEVIWELSKVYKYKIEVSQDDVNWTLALDKTNNSSTQQIQTESFNANSARYVRVTVTGFESGTWASFNEFKVFGQATTTEVNDNTTGTGNNQFSYSANWNYGFQNGAYMSDNHWSATTDAYYEIKFYGTQIKLYGAKDQSYGIASVTIDGVLVTNVDQYSATRADNVLIYTSPSLQKGEHTIRVKVTGTKNPSSSNCFINADRAEVII